MKLAFRIYYCQVKIKLYEICITHYFEPASQWFLREYWFVSHLTCAKTSAPSFSVEQLIISKPQFMSTYISEDWKEKYPRLSALLDGDYVAEVKNKISLFETLGSRMKMIHFSKSSNFNNDLYEHLVAPKLGLGLQVETWRHGSSEPSVCNGTVPWVSIHLRCFSTTHKIHDLNIFLKLLVINIEELKFVNPPRSYSSYDDHAKWAATIPKRGVNKPENMWICLGDINRMFSQYHRGGGTMCINNAVIWKTFSGLVSSTESCDSSR
ncbi:hypothetical protein FGIG_07856 [Fasciola gigantica]|uniref:Uncharacterized protein n=1 Tax=Fasciola gigantica TaxID=46835 RepID=A0A504Y6S0_FASGI|nr:hypothetical protein FGIG_07856 [Fasciola gigantica]